MTETPTPAHATAPDYGKAYFIDAAKELLLDQHLHVGSGPLTADGEKLTRFEQGVREGRIATYLDVILNIEGDPAYDVEPETLRVMLLGQALTEHVQRSR